MDISVNVDTSEIVNNLLGMAKQIPFAVASSLTETAKQAAAFVRRKLPQTFTLRGNWLPGGIRFKPATKATLTAMVGSRSEHMRIQAQGGRLPGKAAIPTELTRTSSGVKLGRSKWPAAMWRRRKALQILAIRKRGQPDKPLTMVGGKAGLWQRTGKGRFPVRPLYLYRKEQSLPPRWDFAGQVSEFTRARWKAISLERILKTIRTARRR